ncbi:MAG: tRNA preQ1(34) S-adenosylmethionine ribosyltransferase-isomerase QueA [Eubacteriaceae bacterium]|nr:tRNA preQ1(34) S-adenosylmethionine ribosyltransferase-isomerase QueA [Eubacteriaceae bacterium]
MKKSDYSFDLPEKLIAQNPEPQRDRSRMLVYDRQSGLIEHKLFCDLVSYLEAGDVLVLNNTKVMPSRLFGTFESNGAAVEALVLGPSGGEGWEMLLKPARKAKVGSKIKFGAAQAVITGILQGGIRVADFDTPVESLLESIGATPLPPYIKKTTAGDERYQTVYAQVQGSSAAPTAGLHFTKALLEQIAAKGVAIAYLLLHVGVGTFRPVREELVSNHVMHEEEYELSKDVADSINKARSAGGRIVAVGTTSVRTLETCAGEDGILRPGKGKTGIFIYPGYKFKAVDALITNFHLPESTLLMLVSAFMGREEALEMYNAAIKEKYMFYSFGHACFIK